MKLKGSFDAKRLRTRQPRTWGARLAAGLSALLATLGVPCSGCVTRISASVCLRPLPDCPCPLFL